MSRTKIKLCGLKRSSDIETANALMPDYIGFVFVKGSKRYVDKATAMRLSAMLKPSIQPVGVFMNQTLDEILEIVGNAPEESPISVIQLHGSEDNAYIHALKEKTGLPVIKAFGVKCEEDVKNATESAADMVLLDSPGGGTGTTFDHRLLSGIKRPFFLAGGLDPENVYALIETIRPFGVDASSGLETDGYKDKDKMERFVSEVNRL